jgi:hypothetical protein
MAGLCLAADASLHATTAPYVDASTIESGEGPVRSGLSLYPELGTVRYCRVCQEWLPADGEFFYIYSRGERTIFRCRTCNDRRTRAWRRRTLADPIKGEALRARWRQHGRARRRAA